MVPRRRAHNKWLYYYIIVESTPRNILLPTHQSEHRRTIRTLLFYIYKRDAIATEQSLTQINPHKVCHSHLFKSVAYERKPDWYDGIEYVPRLSSQVILSLPWFLFYGSFGFYKFYKRFSQIRNGATPKKQTK